MDLAKLQLLEFINQWEKSQYLPVVARQNNHVDVRS